LSDKSCTCDMENRSTFVGQHCWATNVERQKSDVCHPH